MITTRRDQIVLFHHFLFALHAHESRLRDMTDKTASAAQCNAMMMYVLDSRLLYYIVMSNTPVIRRIPVEVKIISPPPYLPPPPHSHLPKLRFPLRQPLGPLLISRSSSPSRSSSTLNSQRRLPHSTPNIRLQELLRGVKVHFAKRLFLCSRGGTGLGCGEDAFVGGFGAGVYGLVRIGLEGTFWDGGVWLRLGLALGVRLWLWLGCHDVYVYNMLRHVMFVRYDVLHAEDL